MPSELVWLILALTAGLTSSYTTRVMARGGIEALDSQGMFRSAVGVLGFFALVGALIWGFIRVSWWWVILAFLGVSLVIAAFGGRERIALMLAAQPILDIACIGIFVYLCVVLSSSSIRPSRLA